MPITIPPSCPITVRRSCGSEPWNSGAVLPQFPTESFLPDDLLLGAQGIRFESSNPVPLTDEGSLDVTSADQYRAVRVRRSTPEGTLKRIVIAVDLGNQVHAALGTTEQVDLNPPSESAVETLPEQAAQPAPDTDTSSDSSVSSGGPTGAEITAYLLSVVTSGNAAARYTPPSAPYTGPSYVAPPPAPTNSSPVTYSTGSGSTYTGSAPTTTPAYTPAPSYDWQTPQEQYLVGLQGGGSTIQVQDTLEQLELLNQAQFGTIYYGY